MTKTKWIVAAILCGLAGLFIFDKSEQNARRADLDNQAAELSKLFHAYSDSCRQAYGSRDGLVLDWRGITGPWETSTGYKFQGRADLGNKSRDVTCYFNKSGQFLQATIKNTEKDPQQLLRDLANGN